MKLRIDHYKERLVKEWAEDCADEEDHRSAELLNGLLHDHAELVREVQTLRGIIAELLETERPDLGCEYHGNTGCQLNEVGGKCAVCAAKCALEDA